jgi:hypothetical protein
VAWEGPPDFPNLYGPSPSPAPARSRHRRSAYAGPQAALPRAENPAGLGKSDPTEHPRRLAPGDRSGHPPVGFIDPWISLRLPR